MIRNFLQILSIFFLIPNLSYAEKSNQENKGQCVEEGPLPLGNFSVPLATQIAPLVSFGQLLIGKKTLFPQLTGNYTRGHNSYADTIVPNIIYGIREDFSASFFVPFNPKSRSDSSYSSGIGDIFLQW